MNRLLRIVAIIALISLATRLLVPASFFTVTALSILIGLAVAISGRGKDLR